MSTVLDICRSKRSRIPFVFNFQIPLANLETLFTVAGWAEAFQFANAYLQKTQQPRLEPTTQLQITFYHLYFSKRYVEGRNFEQAEELCSKLGETNFGWCESSYDEDPYPSLSLGHEQSVSLYEYKGSTCMQIGQAVGSDRGTLKYERDFPHEPIVWKVSIEYFLTFVDQVEKILLGQGAYGNCIVCMDIAFPGGLIEVGYSYRSPFDTQVMLLGEHSNLEFLNFRMRPRSKIYFGKKKDLQSLPNSRKRFLGLRQS